MAFLLGVEVGTTFPVAAVSDATVMTTLLGMHEDGSSTSPWVAPRPQPRTPRPSPRPTASPTVEQEYRTLGHLVPGRGFGRSRSLLT